MFWWFSCTCKRPFGGRERNESTGVPQVHLIFREVKPGLALDPVSVLCGRVGDDVAEAAAAHFARLLFLQRMRAAADRAFVSRAFAEHWGTALPGFRRPPILASPEAINIGWATLQRAQQGEAKPVSHFPSKDCSFELGAIDYMCLRSGCTAGIGTKDDLQLLQGQGAALESLAQCMQLSWMCILVGPSGSGERPTFASCRHVCTW